MDFIILLFRIRNKKIIMQLCSRIVKGETLSLCVPVQINNIQYT